VLLAKKASASQRPLRSHAATAPAARKAEKLPIETAGSLPVFKHARMSYALVLDETAPIHIGDHVTSP
jgi:hypothetical protein